VKPRGVEPFFGAGPQMRVRQGNVRVRSGFVKGVECPERPQDSSKKFIKVYYLNKRIFIYIPVVFMHRENLLLLF
jgi:hypothetical protein